MKPNIILKYQRPNPNWVCPVCDTENEMSATYCSLCGDPKPDSPYILKAWSKSEEEALAKKFQDSSTRSAKTVKSVSSVASVPTKKGPVIPDAGRRTLVLPKEEEKRSGSALVVILTTLIIIAIVAIAAVFIYNIVNEPKPKPSTSTTTIPEKEPVETPVVIDDKKETYSEAMEKYESGDYKEALRLFEALPYDYEDTKTMVSACKYEIASDYLDDGDYEKARELFLEIGNYKDAATMVKECDYQKATDLMNSGNYKDAAELFESISSHNDSADQAKECNYKYAIKLFDEGNYTDAKPIFSSLGNYKDSQQYYHTVTTYISADEYVSKNEYVDALKLLYDSFTEGTSGSKFLEVEGKLESYNSSNGYLQDVSDLYGLWKDSYGYTLEYFYDYEDNTPTSRSTIPKPTYDTYDFKNGMHYYKTSSGSYEMLWAIQQIDSSHIKLFNYYDGKIYYLTK